MISSGDGGTEFASTYAAYDDLTEEEKERFTGLRVIHTLEATLRPVYPDPTPEQVADWRSRGRGRSTHSCGSTGPGAVRSSWAPTPSESWAWMPKRVTRSWPSCCATPRDPSALVRHDWTVGDMVLWDNTGVLHRVTDHNPASRRELHRVTVAGEEPIR